MHDISDLERRGIPGVFVDSEGFVDAAEIQASALGHTTARVFTPHPIHDRTDDEMREIADATVDALIAKLTGPQD